MPYVGPCWSPVMLKYSKYTDPEVEDQHFETCAVRESGVKIILYGRFVQVSSLQSVVDIGRTLLNFEPEGKSPKHQQTKLSQGSKILPVDTNLYICVS